MSVGADAGTLSKKGASSKYEGIKAVLTFYRTIFYFHIKLMEPKDEERINVLNGNVMNGTALYKHLLDQSVKMEKKQFLIKMKDIFEQLMDWVLFTKTLTSDQQYLYDYLLNCYGKNIPSNGIQCEICFLLFIVLSLYFYGNLSCFIFFLLFIVD